MIVESDSNPSLPCQTYCPSQKRAICPYVVCIWWGWKTPVLFRKWILAIRPSNSI